MAHESERTVNGVIINANIVQVQGEARATALFSRLLCGPVLGTIVERIFGSM